MVRLDARLAVRAEEGFQSLETKGLDHGNIDSRNLTAINTRQRWWTPGRSAAFDHPQGARLVFCLVRHACLPQNPAFNLGVPMAQQVQPANPVMLLCGRAWLVAQDLRRDSRGALYPFRQGAKGPAQAVDRQCRKPGKGLPNALLCMMRGSWRRPDAAVGLANTHSLRRGGAAGNEAT